MHLKSPFLLLPLLTHLTPSTALLKSETRPLLSSDLATLPPIHASLFTFYNNTPPSQNLTCKVFPGDPTWPSDEKWDLLDKLTGGGALIKTIPLAAPCYAGLLYDKARCEVITSSWSNSTLHTQDPTSMMSPLFQGRTCLPPSIHVSENGLCTLGGYPVYALNVSHVAQIQLAVNFARNTGVRLVVKNTGHDFSGKSGGAGALSVWVHGLKELRFLDEVVMKGYIGPAFEAGTGVQAYEIYEAAEREGVMVVGGEGKTVGVMGGYFQGGGHSPLSSIYGMGADSILSINVVLPSGEFITASALSHPDIFWALRGGGGSTFGIVTSVIVKAHPATPVTSFSFSFGVSDSISSAAFWSGIRAFFDYFPVFTEAGTYSYFRVTSTTFNMTPFFAPNLSVPSTITLLRPWFSTLSSLGIHINSTPIAYPSFHSAWAANFPQEPVGGDKTIYGSRLWPRKNWESGKELLDESFEVWKSGLDEGLVEIIGFNFAPRWRGDGVPDNAVLPAWRETLMHSIQFASFPPHATPSQILSQRQLLSKSQAAWRRITPVSGSYLGESDREEADFEASFYGANYERLLRIKRRVDPEGVLWAKTAVGSRAWAVRSLDGVGGLLGDENGRLCRGWV